MGHYLSDFETADEHYARVVIGPMRTALRTYQQECKRGIMHTDEWNDKMATYDSKIQAWEEMQK